MNEKNAQLVAGIRDLIAFIEANDDFEFVTGEAHQVVFHWRDWYLDSADSSKRRARLAYLAQRLGKAEKQYSGDFFWLRHDFGPHVRIEAASERDVVCERVVTGTRLVPAQEAYTMPALPEHEEEIVEWKCAPILADEPEQVSAE